MKSRKEKLNILLLVGSMLQFCPAVSFAVKNVNMKMHIYMIYCNICSNEMIPCNILSFLSSNQVVQKSMKLKVSQISIKVFSFSIRISPVSGQGWTTVRISLSISQHSALASDVEKISSGGLNICSDRSSSYKILTF